MLLPLSPRRVSAGNPASGRTQLTRRANRIAVNPIPTSSAAASAVAGDDPVSGSLRTMTAVVVVGTGGSVTATVVVVGSGKVDVGSTTVVVGATLDDGGGLVVGGVVDDVEPGTVVGGDDVDVVSTTVVVVAGTDVEDATVVDVLVGGVVVEVGGLVVDDVVSGTVVVVDGGTSVVVGAGVRRLQTWACDVS